MSFSTVLTRDEFPAYIRGKQLYLATCTSPGQNHRIIIKNLWSKHPTNDWCCPQQQWRNWPVATSLGGVCIDGHNDNCNRAYEETTLFTRLLYWSSVYLLLVYNKMMHWVTINIYHGQVAREG